MIATTTHTQSVKKLVNLIKLQNPQKYSILQNNIQFAAEGTKLNTFDATGFYDKPSEDFDWSAPIISDYSFYSNPEPSSFWDPLFKLLQGITYPNGTAIKKFKSIEHMKLLLDNALQIYSNAKSAGFSTSQILGLLGNALIESSWNPTRVGGSYKGLFLMGGAERQNYERTYGNDYSIENQINYLKSWRDNTNYGKNYTKAHSNSTNAATSALHFAKHFERCSKITYNARQRVAAVLELYLKQLQGAGYFK